METYNKRKVVATIPSKCIEKTGWIFLLRSYERSVARNYYLGAKLVRGAYMVKRALAKKNVPSPIQRNQRRHRSPFNEGIRFCMITMTGFIVQCFA